MADEAERYWKKFEEETGERVETRAMGQWYEDPAGGGDAIWGLFVVTDRSFRYRYLPSESWMTSLFGNRNESSRKREPMEIVVPRGEILGLTERSGGFLSRLFGSSYVDFKLTWKASGGAAEVHSCYFAGERSFIGKLRTFLSPD